MCEALNGKHLSVLGVFAPSRTEWPRRGQGCQSLLVTTMRRIRFPLLEPSVMWLSGWNSGIPLLIGKGCGLSRICQIMKPTFFFFFISMYCVGHMLERSDCSNVVWVGGKLMVSFVVFFTHTHSWFHSKTHHNWSRRHSRQTDLDFFLDWIHMKSDISFLWTVGVTVDFAVPFAGLVPALHVRMEAKALCYVLSDCKQIQLAYIILSLPPMNYGPH